MQLTTRCPECGTVFAVSLDQLKLRKGYIRCVHCANIFDGFDAVVADSVGASSSVARAPAPVPRPAPSDDAFIGHAASAPLSGEPALGDIDNAPLNASAYREPSFEGEGLAQDEANDDDAPDKTPGASSPRIFLEPRTYRNVKEAGNEFLTDRRRAVERRSSGLRWIFVLVVLLLAASLLAYAFRAQLAAEVPQSRPWLEKACERLGCTVDYPQRIDRIAIMSSSLQAVPPVSGQPTMQLALVMRNTYDKAQQWPVLKLDLVDFSGAIVARRVLQPADYLDERQVQTAFLAGQEVRLNIPVPVNGLKVNGYQLDKYFPQKD